MNEFKVGDWVRIKTPIFEYDGTDRIAEGIKKLNIKNMWIFDENHFKMNPDKYIEHWQPQKGEWCWFYDKTSSAVPILAQFDYMSEHIYVTTEIEIPFSGEERSAYGFNSCIPFIGQLPRILKD